MSLPIYHLDSSVVVAWSRGKDPALNIQLRSTGFDQLAISYIVEAELRVGLLKSHYPTQHPELIRFLGLVRIVHSTPSVVALYARTRAVLESSGMRIGDNDLWIAACALAEDAVLVTRNTREFSRVAGLKIEDWMA